MEWLKNKLRKWLELEVIECQIAAIQYDLDEATRTAADVHFKDDTIVIVVSRLQHGNVQIIDAHFDSIRHLQEWVRQAIPRRRLDVVDAVPDVRGDLIRGL